jgi:hypothetical protein
VCFTALARQAEEREDDDDAALDNLFPLFQPLDNRKIDRIRKLEHINS